MCAPQQRGFDIGFRRVGQIRRKGCDLIIANDVGIGTGVMGGDENAVHIVSPDSVVSLPRLPKTEIADRLIRLFTDRLVKGPSA